MSSSVVEERQVEQAEALGIGDQVDLDDPTFCVHALAGHASPWSTHCADAPAGVRPS